MMEGHSMLAGSKRKRRPTTIQPVHASHGGEPPKNGHALCPGHTPRLAAHAVMRLRSVGEVKLPTTAWVTAVGLWAVTT